MQPAPLRSRQDGVLPSGTPLGFRVPEWTGSLESLRALRLPPAVVPFIARYEQVGSRNPFLWPWCWQGADETTLALVPAGWREHVLTTKLMWVILNVLLDDLADQRGSASLLDAALSIPLRSSGRQALPPVPLEDRDTFILIAELWNALEERVRELPLSSDYRSLYVFDCEQLFNSMRYAVLTRNLPGLHNLAEHRAYTPHNMNMVVFGTLDLMTAPVRSEELGAIREALWCAQHTGQIANMLVTWRREVPDRDFSSRVFVHALELGVLTAEQLQTLPPEQISALIESSGLEQLLLSEWQEFRQRLALLPPRVRSFDLGPLLRGVDVLLGMHLAARGLL